MSVLVTKAFLGLGWVLASASVVSYFQRNTAREHLTLLRELKERYEREDERVSANTRRAARRQKDEAWYRTETLIQEQWLARPFYRQLWFPPQPDYVN